MKNLTFQTGLIVILAVIMIGAGCQTQPAANSGNAANSQASSTDHSGHDMSNMNGMNGNDMSNMNSATSAPNAAGEPFDLQFIDTMIHHHEGALKMSEAVIAKTPRAEVKTFAQKIIDDQKKEIATMKGWREQWYAGRPSALNMELPGMKMSGMGEMSGTKVDHEFLEMMTQHHEGAVLMAQEATKRAEHAEIKTLAEGVIKAQKAEIEKMQRWQKEWDK